MGFDDIHVAVRLSKAVRRDADGKVIKGERTNLLDNAKGFDNVAWTPPGLVLEYEDVN